MIIASGTPDAVSQVAESHTGQFLRELLARELAAEQ
jgi:excinuclease UvrABC ATPase subunit